MNAAAPRIWILDDEPDVLAYLLVALEDEGYDVQGFQDAEALLRSLDGEAPPDLLCLDILLPEESGLSIYKTVRHRPDWQGVPVVIVSGYSRREELTSGEFRRLLGDDSLPLPEGFVEKPVALPELLALLEALRQPEEGAPGGSLPVEVCT